jgi:hypothetical protein
VLFVLFVLFVILFALHSGGEYLTGHSRKEANVGGV